MVAIVCEHVDPRTSGQITADWFIERMLALTASQIAAQLRAAAPKILLSHPLRGAFEPVLKYAGLLRLLPTKDHVEPAPTPAQQQMPHHQQVDEESVEAPNPLNNEPAGSTDEIARTWFSRIMAWDPNLEVARAFATNVDIKDVPLEVVKKILELANGRVLQSESRNRARLVEFIVAQKELRFMIAQV
jgi:hypothetical protein